MWLVKEKERCSYDSGGKYWIGNDINRHGKKLGMKKVLFVGEISSITCIERES